jgi:hypothetical protein
MQMVIHDMRNPTVSMDQSLSIAVSQLREIEDLVEHQELFSVECIRLMESFKKDDDVNSLPRNLMKLQSILSDKISKLSI